MHRHHTHHTHRLAALLGTGIAAATLITLTAGPAHAESGAAARQPQSATAPAAADTRATELTFTVSTGGAALNIRSCARLSCGVRTTIPNGTFVTVDCQTSGDRVTGHLGTSSVWDRILGSGGPIGFASDTNIRSGFDGFHPNLPRC